MNKSNRKEQSTIQIYITYHSKIFVKFNHFVLLLSKDKTGNEIEIA